jgi:hypothetical protein
MDRMDALDTTDECEISLDQAATDFVTAWIRTLAIDMIVLGAVFAVLDQCRLLPQLPGSAPVEGRAD